MGAPYSKWLIDWLIDWLTVYCGQTPKRMETGAGFGDGFWCEGLGQLLYTRRRPRSQWYLLTESDTCPQIWDIGLWNFQLSLHHGRPSQQLLSCCYSGLSRSNFRDYRTKWQMAVFRSHYWYSFVSCPLYLCVYFYVLCSTSIAHRPTNFSIHWHISGLLGFCL